MSAATVVVKQKDRVPAMRLFDVLVLYIDPQLRKKKVEEALSALWGKWGTCRRCNMTIAPYADVLWDGENGAFAHAGHISREGAVPWGKVCLPGHSRSVADRLKEREEAKEAQEAA